MRYPHNALNVPAGFWWVADFIPLVPIPINYAHKLRTIAIWRWLHCVDGRSITYWLPIHPILKEYRVWHKFKYKVAWTFHCGITQPTTNQAFAKSTAATCNPCVCECGGPEWVLVSCGRSIGFGLWGETVIIGGGEVLSSNEHSTRRYLTEGK